MIDSILLTTSLISTYSGDTLLTTASGFFYRRDGRLFLVTSKHVVIDRANNHLPDRLVIELHDDKDNLAHSTGYSIPLYKDGARQWREGSDTSGEIDVVMIEIDRSAFPDTLVISAFERDNVYSPEDKIEVGSSILVIGFPLGFHDTLHHFAVARHAVIASSFGFRFQGEGYFLTDGRTHRGISGAPVVMRDTTASGDLPWKLLGVHSSRLDVGTRDLELDEALGLNCAWYADVLETLAS